MYLVYIIVSDNRSYIGMTNDFLKRWKQHNKIIKGGAKYTSKYENWTPICIVDGFKTKSEAMQCEWKLKRARGINNRINHLADIIKNKDKWTKNSPEIKTQNIKVYTIKKYYDNFKPYVTKELEWF
tara:strand:+ start:273 stop:650 length:378 start_codon:yes stop_codon:yes gene_type:complete